ncbi:hypothetical protein [Hymenobacter canadensis]|uniref:Uncharacterized protein n=1 Tax=Hymenobacter canadensis TaxID=2999067 RepID=A0ABY7LU94_9BACT|nr:hypothetical protein [Hymenobacter canadensis]WBA43179.1 hypothetical protein O3303_06340 [Hymenobacter canadensis]
MLNIEAITATLANAAKNEQRIEEIRKSYAKAQNALADLGELLSDSYVPAEKPAKVPYIRPAKRAELDAKAILGTASQDAQQPKPTADKAKVKNAQPAAI